MQVSANVRAANRPPDLVEPWGHLTWLVGQREMPGAELTMGVVTILPGRSNPLHLHPNCEELLFVISGECDHRLGEGSTILRPGSVIRVPRGVAHDACCTSDNPMVAVIVFSAPDRRTTLLEDAGEA